MEMLRETTYGEVWDMTIGEYHATDPWSHSQLKKMNRSPKHFKYDLDNPKPPTNEMDLGTGGHWAILEPDTFGERVIALPPDFNAKKPADREMRDELRQESPEKLVLTVEEIKHCWGMAKEVKEHLRTADSAILKDLLKEGVAERSYFTHILDLPVKSRPDWQPTNLPLIMDLKTTKQDARRAAFERQITNLFYHQSAAMMHDVVAKVENEAQYDFFWMVVEQTPPYGVCIHQADPESLTIGQTKYIYCIQRLQQCLETNKWPGYDHHIATVGLTGWAKKQEGVYE